MIKKIVHRLFVVVFVMFVFPEFMWSAETDNTVSNFTDKISEPITSSENVFSENLFYQDVPLFIGGEAFNTKLEKIRTEENREPLGLILSGGSARAYAHIGVLKKLEEEGLVPDFIVANSMGAIVGILYSAGFSGNSNNLYQ